jgi:conjugal transfer pilus assembly protein TraV
MKAAYRLVAIGLAGAGLLTLGACTTASGLDAGSKFACSAPDGVTCMSVSGIYANSKAGSLPAMQPRGSNAVDAPASSGVMPAVIGEAGPATERSMAQNSSVAGGASGSVAGGSTREVVAYNAPANTVSYGGSTPKTTAKAMSAPHSGAPLRTPERIVRVWMAPFEDAEGDLHDQKYFYVTVTPGSWTIEAHRANIKSTFQQVTPLSRNNAANKEQAAPDPDQLAQQQPRPGLPAGIPQGPWTDAPASIDPDSN